MSADLGQLNMWACGKIFWISRKSFKPKSCCELQYQQQCKSLTEKKEPLMTTKSLDLSFPRDTAAEIVLK